MHDYFECDVIDTKRESSQKAFNFFDMRIMGKSSQSIYKRNTLDSTNQISFLNEPIQQQISEKLNESIITEQSVQSFGFDLLPKNKSIDKHKNCRDNANNKKLPQQDLLSYHSEQYRKSWDHMREKLEDVNEIDRITEFFKQHKITVVKVNHEIDSGKDGGDAANETQFNAYMQLTQDGSTLEIYNKRTILKQ